MRAQCECGVNGVNGTKGERGQCSSQLLPASAIRLQPPLDDLLLLAFYCLPFKEEKGSGLEEGPVELITVSRPKPELIELCQQCL